MSPDPLEDKEPEAMMTKDILDVIQAERTRTDRLTGPRFTITHKHAKPAFSLSDVRCYNDL